MKDYFLPQAQYSKVKIFYSLGCLNGFKFYDSGDKLVFKIGQTKSEYSSKNFSIAADECIIGFKANVHPASQAAYKNFQFIIGKLWTIK